MCVKNVVMVCASVLLIQTDAQGGMFAEMLKAAGRVGAKQLAKEAIEQAAKSSARSVVKSLSTEVAEANARRLAARSVLGLSDDAVRVAATTPGSALRMADDAAEALGKISVQNSRRLMMMADDLESTGKAPEVIALLARHAEGDQIVDFLWRNKATLVGGAAVGALQLNPDEAIAAGSELATTVLNVGGEYVAEPFIESTFQHVVEPAIGGSPFSAWLFIVISVVGAAVGLRAWSKHKRGGDRTVVYS